MQPWKWYHDLEKKKKSVLNLCNIINISSSSLTRMGLSWYVTCGLLSCNRFIFLSTCSYIDTIFTFCNLSTFPLSPLHKKPQCWRFLFLSWLLGKLRIEGVQSWRLTLSDVSFCDYIQLSVLRLWFYTGEKRNLYNNWRKLKKLFDCVQNVIVIFSFSVFVFPILLS